ncbi:MAG: Zn-dependent hydrolase, partial [Candidatus Aminicenantales bacterium]
MDIRLQLDRLIRDIEELGRIGKDSAGGVSRPSFSQPDLEAREWLKAKIREAGLSLREDGAGNIFGRLGGEGKTVMAGSHIDTVLNGGMFDGSVGVLSALECLRTIKEEKVSVSKALEVASFTDEEGHLVGDFLGSRAFTGQLDEENLRNSFTSFGLPLSEVLKETGWTVESMMEAHTQRPDLEAYLELHIEQGTCLEAENVPIGIVEAIAGKNLWMCAYRGEAGHAGTTPFELRRDAFLGLADFAIKSTQYVATRHYGSLMTIGRVQAHPGGFSVVPGRVDFTLDFRSPTRDTLEKLEKELAALAGEVASMRGLEFSREVVDRTAPVRLSERLVSMMREECGNLGYPYLSLTSGAGHDAQIIAAVADAGMIFIPCTDGISHSPQEKIRWEDLEKGANLLLRMLLRLAG